MGLQLMRGLGERELGEIRQLEEACRGGGVLDMKLNWEMLQSRPAAEINDLLYYEDGRLVGFMGLYLIDPQGQEIEITAMIHPGYRRRNIGRRLIAEALALAAARGVDRILLITERSSISGSEFAKAMGFRYTVSEYRMKYAAAGLPGVLDQGIRLRKASPADQGIITKIDALCFGKAEETDPGAALETVPGISPGDADKAETEGFAYGWDATYAAELEGRIIGKICAVTENDSGYIFGFGVLPELRNRGYGRIILRLMVAQLLAANVQTVILEVATQNERALHLYQSCGFREVTVYDYYEARLSEFLSPNCK